MKPAPSFFSLALTIGPRQSPLSFGAASMQTAAGSMTHSQARGSRRFFTPDEPHFHLNGRFTSNSLPLNVKYLGIATHQPGGAGTMMRFRSCLKCRGDLILGDNEWRCMQCGRYYYIAPASQAPGGSSLSTRRETPSLYRQASAIEKMAGHLDREPSPIQR